jgi:hypothetical protein
MRTANATENAAKPMLMHAVARPELYSPSHAVRMMSRTVRASATPPASTKPNSTAAEAACGVKRREDRVVAEGLDPPRILRGIAHHERAPVDWRQSREGCTFERVGLDAGQAVPIDDPRLLRRPEREAL